MSLLLLALICLFAQGAPLSLTLRSGQVVTVPQELPVTVAQARDPARRAQLQRAMDEAVRLALVTAPDDPAAASLALRVVSSTKGLAVEAETRVALALRQQANPTQLALLRDWVDLRGRIAAAASNDADPAAAAALLAQHAWVENELFVDNDAASMMRVGELIELDWLTAYLPERGALLEIVRTADPAGQPRYAAALLRAEGPPRWRDLGPAAPIEDGVGRLREALTGSQDPGPAARALDALVLEPFSGELAGVQNLLVAPDGALNLVPFAALRAPDGRWRGETTTISYLSSGRDILRALTPMQAASGPLILADPAYGTEATAGDRGGHFGRLPGTAKEARAIGAALPGAETLLGDRASEAALVAHKGPSILHIATHGFADTGGGATGRGVEAVQAPDTPVNALVAANPMLRVGLALSGANEADRTGEGVVTGLEAATLDLRGTELVVLSACETGVGPVVPGDGVYALRRAFDLAGAQSQLFSLWKVDDEATAALMAELYLHLARGEGRAASLAAAQEKLRAQPKYQHPRYWSAFVLSGLWGPLDLAPLARASAPATPAGSWEQRLATALRDAPRPGALTDATELGALFNATYDTAGPLLAGHTDDIIDVSWTEGGLLTASTDGSARLIDPRTGRLITLLTQRLAFFAVALAPDARRAATVDVMGTLQLWSLPSGVGGKALKAHDGFPFDVAFSADGARVVSVGQDGAIRWWDANKQIPLPSPPQLRTALTGATFSPDATRVLVNGQDGFVRLLDTRSGAELAVTQIAPPGRPAFLRFSGDGSLAVFDVSGTQSVVWEADSGRAWVLPPEAHAIPAHRSRAVIVERTGISWWDHGKAGPALADNGGAARSRRGSTTASLEAIGPDDMLAIGATLSRPGDLRIVAEWSGFPPDEVEGLRWSPDGTRLLVLLDDGLARLYDARAVARPLTLDGPTQGTTDLAFSPDSRRLLTTSSSRLEGHPQIWEIPSGRLLLTARWDQDDRAGASFFSPDGRTIGSTEGCAAWRADTGACIQREGRALGFSRDSRSLLVSQRGRRWLDLKGATLEPEPPAWSPEDRVTFESVSAGAERALVTRVQRLDQPRETESGLFVVDTRSGARIHTLAPPFKPERVFLDAAGNHALAWRPDGLALWRLDAQARPVVLQDAPSGDLDDQLLFSPDGRRLWAQTCGSRALSYLWDTETGALLARNDTGDCLDELAFSADSRWIATAPLKDDHSSVPSPLEIWDAATGALATRLAGSREGASTVGFSPDGRWIAVVYSRNEADRVVVLPWTPEVLVRQGCARLEGLPEYTQVADLCRS